MIEPYKYSVRRLNADSEWGLYKEILTSALTEKPESYWMTLPEAKTIKSEQWRELCGEIEKRKCTFGGFIHRKEPVGILSAFASDEERWQQRLGKQKVMVLGRLYVRPAHRQTGLSQKLIESSIAWGKGDFTVAIAAARDDNPSSQSSLEKCGFERFCDEVVPKWPSTGLPASQGWYKLSL
jgi:GNAT superfamily N-acetyltransferase